MIQRLIAYRARLLKAGKLREAAAVAYCIRLAKLNGENLPKRIEIT